MSLTVMLSGAAAVGLGAALGALLRWMLALWLNPLHEGVPPGTWVANVAGGYMVGLAVNKNRGLRTSCSSLDSSTPRAVLRSIYPHCISNNSYIIFQLKLITFTPRHLLVGTTQIILHMSGLIL